MSQRLQKDAAIYSELVSIIERDSDAVYDILSTLCTFSLLYNTGHSLQQLERIAKIKSQSTETIMKGKCV